MAGTIGIWHSVFAASQLRRDKSAFRLRCFAASPRQAGIRGFFSARACLILIGILFFSDVPARAAVFHPDTFTLANGLQVVVVQNRLSPAVSQMVWYKAGAADEIAGHTGLAHYLEHLMFKGTPNIPAGAFSRIVAEMGGNDNAFTGHDSTAYYETVAADKLGAIMQMEADRMQNLRITPETASTELQVVLSERQERTGNSPQGLFQEKVRSVLFPRHPYGRPVIGLQEDIARATVEDAREFYEHYNAPNNAIVVISGNVELGDVMRLAAGTFGCVPQRSVPARAGFPALSLPLEQRVEMKDARVQQAHVQVHVVVPSYATQKGREAYALEVLAEALGGGEVGILYKELVLRQKVASGFDVNYDPQMRGPSDFTLIATPQPGKTIEELESALDGALRRLASQGIDGATIAAARGRLSRAAVFARDSLTAPGKVFGDALTTGGSVEDVEKWPSRIRRIGPKDVNAALRKFVRNPHRVTGVLMPVFNEGAVHETP